MGIGKTQLWQWLWLFLVTGTLISIAYIDSVESSTFTAVLFLVTSYILDTKRRIE